MEQTNKVFTLDSEIGKPDEGRVLHEVKKLDIVSNKIKPVCLSV